MKKPQLDLSSCLSHNYYECFPNPPKITSGLRFGTAAATTRGFNQKDFEQVGNMIADILDSLLLEENERSEVFNKTRKDVIELCKKYPIYTEAF